MLYVDVLVGLGWVAQVLISARIMAATLLLDGVAAQRLRQGVSVFSAFVLK